MRLVRLWNISLGKVEGAETVRFYRQGHLWLWTTKNTFSGRKRVRKYPTSLQKRRNPFIYKGFPHRLTIYLTANWLRIAVRFYTITNRCNPLFIRHSGASTGWEKRKISDCEYTRFLAWRIQKKPRRNSCGARIFHLLTISCRKRRNRRRIVDKRFPECYNILINRAHILIFSLSFHII